MWIVPNLLGVYVSIYVFLCDSMCVVLLNIIVFKIWQLTRRNKIHSYDGKYEYGLKAHRGSTHNERKLK